VSRARNLVKAVGRRLRRGVLPLVGQPAVVDELERQRAVLELVRQRVDELDAASGRAGDAIPAASAGSIDTQDVRAALEAEIDRLDGYVVYHADETRRLLDDLADQVARASRIIPAGRDLDVILAGDVFDVVVPTREEGLVTYLVRHSLSEIEPGVRAVLRSRLRAGDVAVDVGANIGLHSLTMAEAVGPTGRLVCFEPLDHLAAALGRTLRLNGLGDRADVRASAVSDTSGRTRIFAAAHSPMTSLFPLPDGAGAEETDVDVTTLDDAFEPGARVDVVKIDVEGAEPRVWRGMKRIRADNERLTIVLEWSASHFARTGERASEFLREIEADGFSISVIEDERPGHTTPLSAEQATTLEAGNVVLGRG
jgi:FkbM family methyltransferase